MVDKLGNDCVELAQAGAKHPDGFFEGYDNVQVSTSIFVEQRQGMPAKVQSGTYSIIYRLHNPNPNCLKLAPLLLRARTASGLDYNQDIRPTADQLRSSMHQFRCYILNVLCRDQNQSEYSDHPAFKYKARRPLPPKHRTVQFPLKISTIDESTTSGNLEVLEDIHLTQLKMTYEDLEDLAILSINDQSTQSHLRSAKALRHRDMNSFTRVQCFQLAIGLFHLCLNLVWTLLHIHRGSISSVGSLTYWFAILEKTRLGCQHPDYHSLLAAMMQILDGLLLDCWRMQSGFDTLAQFTESKPSADTLVNIADSILRQHATPIAEPPESDTTSLRPSDDVIHQNTRLLIHDLLYVAEVTRAISDGDFGRVEDILPTLAMIFRGAGGKNYCTEILHFIHNMKKVWKGDGFEFVIHFGLSDMIAAYYYSQ